MVVLVAALVNVREVARGCAPLLVKVDAVMVVIPGVQPHVEATVLMAVDGVALTDEFRMS